MHKSDDRKNCRWRLCLRSPERLSTAIYQACAIANCLLAIDPAITSGTRIKSMRRVHKTNEGQCCPFKIGYARDSYPKMLPNVAL